MGSNGQQRIAGKIHLSNQTRGKGGAEDGKMDVSGTPGVVMIFPGICAGANRDESIVALIVGECVTAAGEIGIQRSIVLIHFVKVATGCIGLPDFDERVGQRAGVFIQDAAADDDTFAERFTSALASEIEGFAVEPGSDQTTVQ